MAHFVKMENNTCGNIIVVSDEDAPTEEAGQEFIAACGLEGTWMQCSYNTRNGVHVLGGTPFRGNYPSPGMIYDAEKDEFVEAPKHEFTETAQS